MNLPKTFKFERVEDNNRIYWATVTGEKVMVDWSDNDGLPSYYEIRVVEDLVEDGLWKIIESDNVNHPSHYQGKTEVIEIIEQLTEGMTGFKAYCLGNVAKYLFRHEKKGGIEDLKKASWYLNRVIGGNESE